MEGMVVLGVLNAKYVHASPAPWCLAAGVKAYAPKLYSRVRIVEANVNQPMADVLKRITDASPIVVGFSCYIWNIGATLELCRALRQALPNIVIVLGGPEVSYHAKEVLQNNAAVDYILAGEGEESLPAFLRAVLAGENKTYLPEKVHKSIFGLCGRYAKGGIYESSPCVLSTKVPSPFTAGYADAVKGRIAYFETSRGCPYSCAFCLSGRCGRPRFFALDVLQDLLILSNSGARTIKFVDRTFNANALHANQILRFILTHYGKEIPFGTCFHFEIAGDILREEIFALLAKMPKGAVQLEIGMQSFCEKTLEAVQRKTDTAVLQANIRRLVNMGNMHIHIDLIAGLPYEDLAEFSKSFNKGYALKAQMLQLGFLKLLKGSAMRELPERYPCQFDENPPYEVRSTPWLLKQDMALLHHTEDAVSRVYNSGRFRLTADYVLRVSGKTPFEFYTELGAFMHKEGVHIGASLDDYTAALQNYCVLLKNVDKEALRDALVRDRLSTNSTGGLPPCLRRQDEQLAKATKHLFANPASRPQKGVRRGVALLYSAKTICWVDYDDGQRDPVTLRWPLNEAPLPGILE